MLCRAVLSYLLSVLSLFVHAVAVAAPPNILFVIADDWGCHASAYGTPWVKTPAFDSVAREGLLFHHCYTPCAKCAPSRACLLTGRNPWQLGAAANHICYYPTEFKSWCEVLQENGWHVGYTNKGWGPGVANDTAGKPRQMTGKPYNECKLEPATSGISTTDYAANFAAFLETTHAMQPWCFWVGMLEPHRNFEYGTGVKLGHKKISDIDHVPACWPDDPIVRHDMLDYAYEVEHVDSQLQKMLTLLKSKHLAENTIVIVTSDHGMPFPRGKGSTYEMSNHIPLAIRWPQGITSQNRNIQDFVSLIDIAPTLLELAGIKLEKTNMAEIQGTSLSDIFRSEKSGQVSLRTEVFLGRERNDIGRPQDQGYPTRGIRQGEWLYLYNFAPDRWPAVNPETGYLDCDASPTKTLILEQYRQQPDSTHWQLCFGKRPLEELYHMPTDPDQVKNLAQVAEHAAVKTLLKQRLWKALEQQRDPRVLGQGDIFDSYPHANAGHVNFYERFLKGEKLKAGWVLPTDFEK